MMKGLTSMLALFTVGAVAVIPAIAPAQTLQDLIRGRRKQENGWRNGSYAGAGVTLLGILTKNNTLTYAGVGGGLYSLYRYDQDKRSRNKLERQRAAFYSAPYRTQNGKRYKRVKIKRGRNTYYQYVRAR